MHDNNALARQAATAGIESVKKDWKTLKASLGKVKDETIKSVNTAYRIGITFQELCQHEQMRLSFFESIKGQLPRELNYEAARKCIHLANTLDGPVKTLEEATRAMQGVFQAGGFIEVGHRDGSQKSREQPPVMFFYEIFGGLKEKITKQISSAKNWDDEMKTGVRAEITRHRKFLDEMEAKL